MAGENFFVSLRAFVRAHPIAATGLFVALALGGAILAYVAALRKGDEPPIRVKGGSLHFDMLAKRTPSNKWDGSKKNWKVFPGIRDNDGLGLLIESSGDGCVSEVQGATSVTFTYSDLSGTGQGRVTLDAAGKKTKISYSDFEFKFAKDTSGTDDTRKLVYKPDQPGYISSLAFTTATGSQTCNFGHTAGVDDLDQVLILEW